MLVAGLVIVLGMSLLALLAPWIAPYDPAAYDLDAVLMPPSPSICSVPTIWGEMSFPACYMGRGSRYGWVLWLWGFP